MNISRNRTNRVILVSISTVLISTVLIFTSCSKDNVVNQFDSMTPSGSDKVNTMDGTWSMDKTHTNIGWETFYYGDNALLTGRFNNFGVDINFDEADLPNSEISAWVQLSTFNTGEPGRDGAGKCGPSYMGVEWNVDTIPEPDVYTVIAETDTAWYAASDIEKYGDGYVAHGTFNFRGISEPTDLYFRYFGISETENSSGVVTTRSGFQGEFDMLAQSVFGVTSGSIDDLVTVKTNVNLKMN